MPYEGPVYTLTLSNPSAAFADFPDVSLPITPSISPVCSAWLIVASSTRIFATNCLTFSARSVFQ